MTDSMIERLARAHYEAYPTIFAPSRLGAMEWPELQDHQRESFVDAAELLDPLMIKIADKPPDIPIARYDDATGRYLSLPPPSWRARLWRWLRPLWQRDLS